MARVFFLFIGEGQSDVTLVDHLRDLCLICGATEVQSVAPDLSRLPDHVGHAVVDKLRVALKLEPNVNLVFIHRDADSIDPLPRHEEIRKAVEALSAITPYVAIVPVQATEAWLLVDEQAIRQTADNPNGQIPLDLPKPTAVEKLHDPKQKLWELLRSASGLSGRKLERFNKTLKVRRRLLLQRLDPDGSLREVSAWKRLVGDLRAAINDL